LELSLRKKVLEAAGYAVFKATDASKALEIFRVQRIDLVITDTLQGITSHSFAAELRHLSPHVPIMVLSGGSTFAAAVAPPAYYLHKREGPTEMIAKVQ